MTPQHALYRMYDETGQLLYVGISIDPGKRMAQHRSDKPWFSQVANITVQPMPSRKAALEAERESIKNERPTFNVVHNDTAELGESLSVVEKLAWRSLTIARDQGGFHTHLLAEDAKKQYGMSDRAAVFYSCIEWTDEMLNELMHAAACLFNWLPEDLVSEAFADSESRGYSEGHPRYVTNAAQYVSEFFSREYLETLPADIRSKAVEVNTYDGITAWADAADEARGMLDARRQEAA
ncbi:GIY-YIG nuclease family protein [Amycolatopsis sp. NPDC051373]|uniref:GIY-YIG nuclease family protein n=1 Tax=Amycolatopsis sp. NPDC051373 TaxID=3155801 RepID=UPI00344DD4B6